jgi:hypothetical protein
LLQKVSIKFLFCNVYGLFAAGHPAGAAADGRGGRRGHSGRRYEMASSGKQGQKNAAPGKNVRFLYL